MQKCYKIAQLLSLHKDAGWQFYHGSTAGLVSCDLIINGFNIHCNSWHDNMTKLKVHVSGIGIALGINKAVV